MRIAQINLLHPRRTIPFSARIYFFRNSKFRKCILFQSEGITFPFHYTLAMGDAIIKMLYTSIMKLERKDFIYFSFIIVKEKFHFMHFILVVSYMEERGIFPSNSGFYVAQKNSGKLVFTHGCLFLYSSHSKLNEFSRISRNLYFSPWERG